MYEQPIFNYRIIKLFRGLPLNRKRSHKERGKHKMLTNANDKPVSGYHMVTQDFVC